MERDRRWIVSLSGGQDSTTAAFWARDKFGPDGYAVLFDYKQAHWKELHCAVKVANCLQIPFKLVQFELPFAVPLAGGDVSLVDMRGDDDLPGSFVPGRNMIMLSIVASLAYILDRGAIVGGWNAVDYSGYPDCRPEFLTSMETTINRALGVEGTVKRFTIAMPLVNMKKTDIIMMGDRLGVDWTETWTCYKGGDSPCGLCPACAIRMQAFRDLGRKDPLYELHCE